MKYVYFLRNGQDYYKVGVAVNVANRVRTIQTSNPERVTLICSRLVRDAELVESRIHSELVERKSGGGSEWFMLTPEDALDVAALINLEPQPKVLDRQLTIEALLAEMREERNRLQASSDQILKAVTELGAVHKPQPIVVVRDKPAAPSSDEFEPPKVAEDETIKPTMEQYEDMAMRVFEDVGGASSSVLQRRLGIGYAKAARIVDNLEDKGFIGPSPGNSRPRAIINKATSGV